MNIKKIKIISLFLPLIIAGCGGGPSQSAENLKKSKIPHLQQGKSDFEQTQNGVTVRTKLLQTEQECVDLFGKTGKRLLKNEKKKIYPIKLTIENKTNQKTSLHLNNIDLKLAPQKEVLRRIRKSSNRLAGSLALGAGSFVVFEGVGFLSMYGCMAAMYSASALATAGGLACLVLMPVGLIGGLIVPPILALYYGSKRTKANSKLRKKIKRTCPTDVATFKPEETKTFLLFVKQRNYKQNFALSLTNENQNKLKFNVGLPKI